MARLDPTGRRVGVRLEGLAERSVTAPNTTDG